MENIFCADLKLDFAINTDTLQTFKDAYDPTDILTLAFPKDGIDPRAINWLHSVGLCFSEVTELFVTPPGKTIPIHIDADRLNTNNCKINWVFGAAESQMVWWEPNDPAQQIHAEFASWNQAPYVLFNEAECTKIWAANIKQPTLVNSGIPHSIINNTNETRWSLTFELADAETKKAVNWYTAVHRLEKFII